MINRYCIIVFAFMLFVDIQNIAVANVIDLPFKKNRKELLNDNTDVNIESLLSDRDVGVFSDDYNIKKISSDIKNIVYSYDLFLDWQGLSNKIHSLEKLRVLYEHNNFYPLWIKNNRVTELAEQVIKAVSNSYVHALKPETYHNYAISSLRAGQKLVEPAKFDVIISDAFVTLKSHLANGIVNPKEQFPLWNIENKHIDFLALYLDAKISNNIDKVLKVKDHDYRILQKTYEYYLNNNDNNIFTKIPNVDFIFGQHGSAVRILRERLGLGDISNVFDNTVKKALMNYQKRNGLKADGIVDKNTLFLLNMSSVDRLEMLAINMERRRWGEKPDKTYVWVNIPAYKMAIRKGNKDKFKSNVIVGRPSRHTPIFSDVLKYVVLSPYWNVPKTIFEKDKLPLLKENPDALGPGMEAIDKLTGDVVSLQSVDWNNESHNYRLRQKPGPHNALGRFKFLFPNKYSIYLHDTPNRKLFKKANRDFSSGCVRVEDARGLATFLLKNMGYDKKGIETESNKEKWVKLNKEISYPIFLEYYTSWSDEGNKVYYSPDIYGFDKILKRLYKRAINSL